MKVLSSLLLLALCICSLCEEERLVFIPDDGQKFSSNLNTFATVAPIDRDFSQNLKLKQSTNDGRKMVIYDGVFNSSLLFTMKSYITLSHKAWRYNIYESYEGGKRESGDNVAWINDVNIEDFSRTMACRILQKLVQDASGISDQVWLPFNAQGKIIRRADFTHVYSSTNDQGKEYTALIYLNDEWRKNFYGELYLYDDKEEIFAGSVPRFGRVVIWDSSIPYLLRPPSFAVGRGELLLFIQFTKDINLVSGNIQNYHDKIAARESVRQKWFTSDLLGVSNLNPLPNLVSEFSSSEGKKIFVFDGLFEKSELDRLRKNIIHHGVYFYDDEDVDDSDNVQWIAGFSVDDYVKGYFWNITRQVIKFTSGGQDEWFPYDVSCNLIRSGDHTRIHHDCEPHEDEWTFILYLNPHMVHDDYGETTFYERNSDDTEIITEIIPKYGRAVVFQGIIPHSARPPSPKFREARLTFVTKVSKNEWTGRVKNLHQDSNHWAGLKQTMAILKDISKTGNADKYIKMRQSAPKKYPTGKRDDRDEEEDEEGDHDLTEEEYIRQGQDDEKRSHNDQGHDKRERDHKGQEGDKSKKRDDDSMEIEHGGQEEDGDKRDGDHESMETEHGGQEEDEDNHRMNDDEIQIEEVQEFLQKIREEAKSMDRNPSNVKKLQGELERNHKESMVLASEELFQML